MQFVMQKSKFKQNQGKAGSQSGFTILEMMVVLAIIGGIMALVATNIIGSSDDSKIKTTKTQIKLLEGALDLYRLDNHTYPTEEQGLEALQKKPQTSPEPKNYRSGGYLKGNNVPKDAWDNEFAYFMQKGRYEIVSWGGDGEEGGEEINADISSKD